jgi:hypothetical protein
MPVSELPLRWLLLVALVLTSRAKLLVAFEPFSCVVFAEVELLLEE